jgi:hypothetical protein
MKKLILITTIIFSLSTFSQEVSCNALMDYVEKNDSYPQTVNCFNSSLLVKVKRYEVGGATVVVAYIKKNEYDFRGKPYIFCGISSYTWTKFTSDGTYNSWGKAFHKYIMDNKCNCS